MVDDIGSSEEDMIKWLSARKLLWRAISCKNKHPWPSCNPEFMPIEASDDSDMGQSLRVIPVWDRPKGAPIVNEEVGTKGTMKWLQARKCLWKAISSRNSHPWPSENPCFVEIEDQEEVVELTPEWLSWLENRKVYWKEISLKRKLKRKAKFEKDKKLKLQEENSNQWVFNCSCGLVDVEGFDDHTSQVECFSNT